MQDIMQSATTQCFNDDVFPESRVLKSCPFCGAYAMYCEDMRFFNVHPTQPRMFPKWYVMCTGCQIRTPVADIPKVTKFWNRRHEGEDNK